MSLISSAEPEVPNSKQLIPSSTSQRPCLNTPTETFRGFDHHKQTISISSENFWSTKERHPELNLTRQRFLYNSLKHAEKFDIEIPTHFTVFQCLFYASFMSDLIVLCNFDILIVEPVHEASDIFLILLPSQFQHLQVLQSVYDVTAMSLETLW